MRFIPRPFLPHVLPRLLLCRACRGGGEGESVRRRRRRRRHRHPVHPPPNTSGGRLHHRRPPPPPPPPQPPPRSPPPRRPRRCTLPLGRTPDGSGRPHRDVQGGALSDREGRCKHLSAWTLEALGAPVLSRARVQAAAARAPGPCALRRQRGGPAAAAAVPGIFWRNPELFANWLRQNAGHGCTIIKHSRVHHRPQQ